MNMLDAEDRQILEHAILQIGRKIRILVCASRPRQQGHPFFTAESLEFNRLALGKSEEDAVANVIDMVGEYLRACWAKKLKPAPQSAGVDVLAGFRRARKGRLYVTRAGRVKHPRTDAPVPTHLTEFFEAACLVGPAHEETAKRQARGVHAVTGGRKIAGKARQRKSSARKIYA